MSFALDIKTADDLEADKLAESKAIKRAERNRLLAASDWTQVSDAPVDQTKWAAYRQELRDLTNQPGFPDDVVWPEEP